LVVADRLMPETFRLAVPELTIVAIKGLDELPTATLPKSWLAGPTEMLGTGGGGGAAPFPVSATVAFGVSGSFEVIVSTIFFVPVDAGLNVMLTVQLLPAPTVGAVLPQGFEPPLVTFRAKSVVAERLMPETLRDAPPVLSIITCKADDELPTFTEPKLWEVGETTMLLHELPTRAKAMS
jgi:hypothetical protein